MDLLPLPKDIILRQMHNCILEKLKSRGIMLVEVPGMVDKNRQCLERFFHPKKQYNPGYYYLYETCLATGIEIPRLSEVDSRLDPIIKLLT